MIVSRDSYLRVKEYFVRLSELSGAERMEILESEFAGDSELREELERLLRAHDERTTAPDAASAVPAVRHPTNIAGYTIIGVLGVGGMGVVYRARQKQPAREVALKVLRAGLMSNTMRRRFEQEVEVLGRLQHPGIAQVHDAGQWDSGEGGQPYFAMELVDGSTLTDYCLRECLSTNQRVALLASVADAVEHAHRHGVIHRDLKPGNILVTADGSPKILDFGVARATDSDLRASTIQTSVGQLVGTIPYMSPEQVSGDPAAIDHRSDIYSLGVLMYELLTGEPPLELLQKNLPNAIQAIRDDDPAPLSSFNRTFRGDLDTIVVKAMEKEPVRRYASAAEFAGDLRRFINEQPILARPASLRYQLGKFARRHKGLVAGLALAMLMLAAGTIVSTVFAIRAERRSRQWEIEAQRVTAANRFFTDMLDAANPDINRLKLERPRDVRVVDVLDFAARNLATAYANQPAVEMSIRRTLSETYARINQGEKAFEQIGLASAIADRTLKADDPERIRLTIARAGLITGLARHMESENILRPLLATSERVNGVNHPDTIACLNGLFGAVYYQDRLAEAHEIGEDALARARNGLPADHAELRVALNNLAYVLGIQGEHARAEPLYREALEVSLRVYGEDHPATILAWRNLVMALRPLGRTDEAIEIMRGVVAAQSRLYGEEDPQTLLSMNNLAILLRDSGDEAQSQQILEAIVNAHWRAGRENGDSLLAEHNLANSFFRQKQYDRAQQLAQRTFEALVREFGVDQAPVAHTQWLLGQVLAAQGRDAEATPHYRDALATYVRVYGNDHSHTTSCRLGFAQCLNAVERFEQAEAEFQALYDSSVRVNGPQHETTLARQQDLMAAQQARMVDSR